MLILYQENRLINTKEGLITMSQSVKKLKTKCCKKHKKKNRCKNCPCFDLIQKAY